MKKFFIFLIILFCSFSVYSQQNSTSLNVTRNFKPALDTLMSPLWVGEIRIRLQDTAFYICISRTSPRKWVRYWDKNIPPDYNYQLQPVTHNGATRIVLGARSVLSSAEESILYLDSIYAGLFGRTYIDIRGRAGNPRVPVRLGALSNSLDLDSILRMNPVGELVQVALRDLPKDTLMLKRYEDSIYLVQYLYKTGRDSANVLHVKDLVYRDRYKWDIYEEFISSGFGGNFVSNTANSGGAFVTTLTSASHFGEAQIQTASSANARAAIGTSENILFNSSTYTFEVDDLNMNALNNGTDSIYLYIGFFDNMNSDDTPIDGAYIRYDAGSTSWQICTRNNSTETIQTPTSVVAATTNYKLTVVGNSSGVSFYVNGTQIGTTITTNIPQTVGRGFGMGVKIMKRGGTNLRSVNFDRFKFKIGD